MSNQGSILFTPKRLGKFTIANRFMRSATWEALADSDGNGSKKLFDLMENLSKGGVGLIVPGAVCCTKSGFGLIHQSGMYTTKHSEDWKPVVEKMHKNGSKVVFQVIHGGAACTDRSLNGNNPPFVPTAFTKEQHELTNAEIEELIENFANSAKLSYLAGADGVQFHCAHGYLLSSFMSPATNHRKDKWGENRLRILEEIISTTRARVPESFSFSIKFNVNDCVPGGITPHLASQYVGALKSKLDFFEISCGMEAKYIMRSNYNEDIAVRGVKKSDREMIKQQIMAAYSGVSFHEIYNFEGYKVLRKDHPEVHFALVGGNRVFSDMEHLVEREGVDVVSMARPFICNPNLVNDFRDNKIDKSECISCGSCLFNVEKGIYCHLPRK
ncbi:oxidoreductase, FAD/FMN-binding family protein [Histomonas meleagridis]|uniref:oxidoreductase, FAD/FMN-binding family protein n=1 Tax=Histomonas meleagridis TaxID=135588 RepID=UPI0035599AA7|nr:oxidoreductase, FAD/FMN-binding family protein [Histomonas meleagridis]KAH0796448.1 oxidoreductase, FAD/FMN-binding family protein [Histomonas meleagridis]